MGKYVNGVYVPENETDAFALGKFSNGQPQNQTAPASQTLTPEQEENSRIGAERASRMTNPEQTSFNLFAKPQPTQPVATPTTPAKTTPVNTTPVNQNARTQNPYNQITSMDDLAKAMGYTSPQEEERLRKASVANRRILAVADAMRHIGNIYNTVRYAPAQQFNQPVLEEQSRYERGKAMRDKANQVYLSYQQQKAAQDAKQKQWEQQFKYNMAKDAANYELKRNESEARQQRQRALAALDDARLKGQLDKNTYQRLVNQYYPENAEARIREIESRISKNNRTGGGGSGSRGGSGGRDFDTTITYDPNEYDPNSGKLIRKGTQHTERRYNNLRGSNNAFRNFSIRKK